VLLAIALPFAVSYLLEQSRLNIERRRAQWRQKWFDDVKNGDTQAMVMDSELLPMLANDPECVANLESLYFSCVTIAPEDAKHVARLTNVKDIGFYDTSGADVILDHAGGLPIESLFFECSPVSHDSLRALSEFSKLQKVHFEQGMSPDEIAILKELRPEIVVEIPYPSESEPGSGNRGQQPGEPDSESAG
jgi:hypothetical protein